MLQLKIGYTIGKKTKNKKIEIIVINLKQHGYNYSQLREIIKKEKKITGKIHISYCDKLNFIQ